MTHSKATSKMVAISQPQSWGYEAIDIFYGEIVSRPHRTLVLAGEALRSLKTGEIFEFNYREGDKLDLTSITF